MASWRRIVILAGMVLAGALLLLALSSCSGGDSFTDRGLDLIVVSVDTMRAGRMSIYGADRPTDLPGTLFSPAWLSEQGTTWDTCWAPAGKTVPSLGSFWTGAEPLEHGALQNKVDLQLATFVQRLKNEGFTTLGRAANLQLSPNGYGFDRGFDDWGIRVKEFEPRVAFELLQLTEAPIQQKEPLMVWAHFMAPHQPYEPMPEHDLYSSADLPPADNETLESVHAHPDTLSPELAEHLRGKYDGEIRTASEYVRRLLRGLDEHYRAAGRGGLLENAIVVFFSDHGEELADHASYFMHAKSIWSGAVQVPLIIAGPGYEAGARVTRPITLADVMPMVLYGEQPKREVFVASWMSDFFSVRDTRWTLVHNPCGLLPKGPFEPPFEDGVADAEHCYPFPYPEVALFDRQGDPTEQQDVANEHPAEVRRLLGELRSWYEGLAIADASTKRIGPSAAQLSELGYAELEGVTTCMPWEPERWKPDGVGSK